jgi:hypothetical protein
MSRKSYAISVKVSVRDAANDPILNTKDKKREEQLRDTHRLTQKGT